MSANQIAQAQIALTEATNAHAVALAKVNKIQQRIADRQTRQREITQQRLEGEASISSAGEFSALSADIEALQGMLADATNEAANLEPTNQAARLADVQRAHENEQDSAAYEVLRGKAQQLETALCRVIARMHAIGQKQGRGMLSQNWRPGYELDRATRLNVPPAVG